MFEQDITWFGQIKLNIPYNLIFAGTFNDSSILITISNEPNT